MERRNKRFHLELPKVYKNKLDALFVKTGKKDLDRAYYAVLLMHYLDNPDRYILSEDIRRLVAKKLTDKKSLTGLALSLNVYDYHRISDYSMINFRSIFGQSVLIYCSLTLSFFKSNVKHLSVSDKFQLIVK